MATVKRKTRPEPPTPKPEPDVFLGGWGPGLFGPRTPADDADGAIIGGMVLRRGPDGTLCAVTLPKKPKEKP